MNTSATPPAPSIALAWIHAARPRTLVASVVPVLVGSATALADGRHEAVVTLVCVVAALLLQVATNLANDAIDHLRGIDSEVRLGPTRVTQAGWLSPRTVLAGTSVVLAAAVACGIYLTWVGGPAILAIGVLAILAALGYSAGPFPLSTNGLGEAAAFLFFGVIATTGASYLHGRVFSVDALLASLPVGALITGIMVVNNLRDIPTDAASGKRTLAVRLGEARTRALYAALLILAFASAPILAARIGAGAFAPLGALPLAASPLRQVRGTASGSDLNHALAATARLLTVYGLLLAAGIALGS